MLWGAVSRSPLQRKEAHESKQQHKVQKQSALCGEPEELSNTEEPVYEWMQTETHIIVRINVLEGDVLRLLRRAQLVTVWYQWRVVR